MPHPVTNKTQKNEKKAEKVVWWRFLKKVLPPLLDDLAVALYNKFDLLDFISFVSMNMDLSRAVGRVPEPF